MIDALSHANVWVDDQDEAKTFYTEKLGFEVREDATLEEFGGYRWLTVGPPGPARRQHHPECRDPSRDRLGHREAGDGAAAQGSDGAGHLPDRRLP